MADHAFDGIEGSEKTGLLPASAVPRTALAPIVPRGGFGRPPQLNTLDPMALLKSFRRRWSLAVGLGVVAAAVVGATAWMLLPPPMYTSKSILRMLSNPPRILFPTNEQYADYRTFQRTQADLIKSEIVLGPALRNPRVKDLPVVKAQPDPKEWLEKEVRVDFSPGSELLMISMSSKNPAEPAPVVDAVVNAYMEQVVESDQITRTKRLEFLRMLMNKHAEELKEKRALIRRMVVNGIGTEDRPTMIMKQQFQAEELRDLERDLHAIQTDTRRLSIYKSIIEKKAAGGPLPEVPVAAVEAEATREDKASAAFEAAVDARIESDAQVQELRRQHEAAKGKFQRLRNLSRDLLDPATVAARTGAVQAYARLIEHRGRLREQLLGAGPDKADSPDKAATSGASPRRADTAELVAERLEILKRNEELTSKDVEALRQQIARFNLQTIDLQADQDEYATLDSTTKQIAREVSSLEVELKAERRVTVVTPADQPRKKDSAKQYMMCGGASFGGFALAILVVSFWEMRSMRIGSVDEVVNQLGLALVGALPALPSRTGKLAKVKAEDQRWQGLLVESIDATRTMLLHASRVNATRAVMITSAMKGEGKTSLAAHLATSLARAGRKTLLIDCDLRRPTLHQLFDVARVPGICELLRGEAEVNDAIRPTPADDLNLMPAGHCDGVALQAIAQDRFRDVLATLKKRYDFIIIDSAPVLPVVDTMLLSQQVDAVLFSIMKDVSRVPHVHAAHDRLASLGVRMLGAVVNAADPRDSMHSYDYEYQTSSTA